MAATVTMYDSTSPGEIPTDAQVVAGYVDGIYEWLPTDWARFPDAIKKTIAVFTSTDADILDSEFQDAMAIDTPAWVLRQRARGADPTVYCSLVGQPGYGWPWVKQAFADAGVAPPHYWIADYTDEPHMVDGSVATQWTDHQDLYDISLADEKWVGLGLPSPHTPSEDTAMPLSVETLPNGTDVVVQIGSDGTVYGKSRAASMTWQKSVNKVIAQAIPGSSPLARVVDTQFQCFIEAADAHVLLLVTTDGIEWDQAELP